MLVNSSLKSEFVFCPDSQLVPQAMRGRSAFDNLLTFPLD
jgi:hypothetical protein